jgi:Peptidase A4 family
MHIRRLLVVAASAAALGGGIALSTASSAPAVLPAARTPVAHTHLTAAFLAEARAALVKDLRTPDTAQFPAKPAAGKIGEITATGSYNWAGYADVSTTAGTFTKAAASWKVPAVTCTSEDEITSEWVGLDGFSTDTVEQDGTSSQCFEGVALYYSWYEMYPAGSVEVGSTVKAGDAITASVTRSGTSYTLALTDSTTSGNNIDETATCAAATCLDESAEVITERPAYATTGIVPEAQFGTVSYSGISITPLNTAEVYDITCVDSTDTYDIVATGGIVGGNGFSNTWDDSY